MKTKQTQTHTPKSCGCRVKTVGDIGWEVVYCPIHAAAPNLLKALKCLQVRIFMLDGSENEEYQMATAAIAQAQGD